MYASIDSYPMNASAAAADDMMTGFAVLLSIGNGFSSDDLQNTLTVNDSGDLVITDVVGKIPT